MTADLQVGLTVFAILFWSAVRININYELSLWVIPFCYTGWQVVIATLWTTGIMPRPICSAFDVYINNSHLCSHNTIYLE